MGIPELSEFAEAAIKVNRDCMNLEKLKAPEIEFIDIDRKYSQLDKRYYDDLDTILYETVDSYIKQQMKSSGAVCFEMP